MMRRARAGQPMPLIHDDEAIGSGLRQEGEKAEQHQADDQKSFHVGLDGGASGMLPKFLRHGVIANRTPGGRLTL